MPLLTVTEFLDAVEEPSAADVAHALGSLGVAVFPTMDKRPHLTPRGFLSAVAEGWPGWPQGWWDDGDASKMGVGVVPAQMGLLVVDVDMGPLDGVTSFEVTTGKEVSAHPHFSMTPSGGFHLWYNHVEGVRMGNGWRMGVDIRGEGGYVQVHAGGDSRHRRYEYCFEVDEPQWLSPPAEVISTRTSVRSAASVAVRSKALSVLDELSTSGATWGYNLIESYRPELVEGQRHGVALSMVGALRRIAEKEPFDLRRALVFARTCFLESEPTTEREREWTLICEWVLSQHEPTEVVEFVTD